MSNNKKQPSRQVEIRELYGADNQWRVLLNNLIKYAHRTQPRGISCLELMNYVSVIDMEWPVVSSRIRKLGYKFMAAEAFWILSGDDRVSEIAPYSAKISQFSDDGITFFGAYGPKILGQIDYIVSTLLKDKDSRQAVMTIWRENPPETKDYPCTVSVHFMIRDNLLYCFDNMRSSDTWLGWPYDVFNFTMLSYVVAAHLRKHGLDVRPGYLYLNVTSQHLYTKDYDAAKKIIETKGDTRWIQLPELLTLDQIFEYLATNKNTGGINPWPQSIK